MVGKDQYSHLVYHNMHKIRNLWKLQENNERKTPLLHKFMCFQMPKKRLQAFNVWVRNYVFLKNCVTSDGVVSHNVLYYQQLSIAHY